jgi:hypothetical protein
MITDPATASATTMCVELIFQADQAIGGVITNLEIKICNPGSLNEETRKAMLACLRNKREKMESSKPDGMGCGLGLVGEQLDFLNIIPDVSSDRDIVQILLSRVKVL